MRNRTLRRGVVVFMFVCAATAVRGQFLMDMIDTTNDLGKGMLSVYKKYDHIRISGYMQPQFQVASDSGINSYAGGDFAHNSNNRFTLRRGRIRFDYARYNKENHPSLQFVFQFDGSERGVFIRDFWGRVWENKWQLFSFTTGMFARPFGYEVNLSSGDRESPERGRMSQTLMKTERDLGAMVSFEPRQGNYFLQHIKLDAGLFNGQGLTSTYEFDSYKDFIGQLSWKPFAIAPKLWLSGGVSMLDGGFIQVGHKRYETVIGADGKPSMIADSSFANGSKLPRKYYGANAQLKLKHGWGATELRAEYWQGTQTGSHNQSETPTNIAFEENNYVRKFNGAFLCFLQNIVNEKNQLVVKYDWYDPNTDVKGHEIALPGSNFTVADICYQTWGFGYLHYFTENLKLVLYYDLVKNESTSLERFKSDVSDNVFTCRLQFRF